MGIVKVDVTIATKNSAGTIERCIRAIQGNVPVGRLIVVDGKSTDDTVSIAEKLGAEVISDTGLLGSVRYLQARECSTEWIAIIDSDVYVYSSWWPEVSAHTDDLDVGMVLAIGDSPLDRLVIYGDYLEFVFKRFGSAAFSNTLVRRELILSCHELLNRVHAGEDTVFARYLSSRGLKVITVQKRLVYHDKNIVDEHPGAFFRWGQSIRIRGGVVGARELAKTLKNNVRNWWLFTKDTHRLSIRLLLFLVYLWVFTFSGYVGVPKQAGMRGVNSQVPRDAPKH